jgi:hypothetical protein
MAMGRKPSTTLSPARAALAAAIEGRSVNDGAIAATRAAMGIATEARERASVAVAAAEAGVKAAQQAAARHLIEQAQGVAGEPPQTVRQAREILTDAQDDLRSADEALGVLTLDLAKLENFNDYGRVENAIGAVLSDEARTAAEAVAAEVIRLQRELVRQAQALAWLVDQKVFPVSDTVGHSYGLPTDDAIRSAHWRMMSPPDTWHELQQTIDGAAEWQALHAALRTDPTAPVPSVTQIRSAA